METSLHLQTTPLLREVAEPLGLFFSLRRNGQNDLKQLLSENRIGFNGVVFDPCFAEHQEPLRTEVITRNLDAILDTSMMELSTVGGHTSTRAKLPWASEEPHTPSEFNTVRCEAVAESIATFVAINKYSAVLAPSHFLAEGAKDSWFAIDIQLTSLLRKALDRNGCKDAVLLYPLAISNQTFLDSTSRFRIKERLADLPLNSIWLKIHPFGSNSGELKLQHIIEACRQFHFTQIPLLIERAGFLGLPLLAFGAVAGIRSELDGGESFDIGDLKRLPRPGQSFVKPARVYLPDLGISLTRKEAQSLLQNRVFRHLACRNTSCCPDGYESMLKHPRRHFVNCKMEEIALLNGIPASIRPSHYIDKILGPVTDKVCSALANKQLPEMLRIKLERVRSKYYGWNGTLGAMSRSVTSISAPIPRRISRALATA